MSASITDIEAQIEHETQLCISEKKNRPFFQFAWMRSRRSFEAGCRDAALNKHAGELAAARQRETDFEDAVRAEFQDEADQDYQQIIKLISIIMVFVIVLAWVIF